MLTKTGGSIDEKHGYRLAMPACRRTFRAAGCATPYQDMGFSGGVLAQQMTANTFRIVARGNGYTGTTTVQDYVMLKAAETAIQNGGTHFVIVEPS
jgi:hypothetical protein